MVQFINPQYDNPSKINTRAMWPFYPDDLEISYVIEWNRGTDA